MNYDEIIHSYGVRVAELCEKYESKSFDEIHGDWLSLLPTPPASVLDIGAGTGRDSAWFSSHGYDVLAVEPSIQMIEVGKRLHSDKTINWICDRLPELKKVIGLGSSFDVILLSGVWMHVMPDDRSRVIRKLSTLLKPGGLLVISLRHGPHHIEGSAHPVSIFELEQLALQQGLITCKIIRSDDLLNRSDVYWETVVLKLPDDGTGSLPLLRNIIVNDRKSSTYKLALLRALLRIADGATNLVEISDDEFVKIPLGLVALYWIRLYKPLIERGIPQGTGSGLGFVKDAFGALSHISPFELRVGAQFHGHDATCLRTAIKDASVTIRKMPSHYITYPNSSDQIFKVNPSNLAGSTSSVLAITPDFLWSFGSVHVPFHIWLTLTRHAAWIEPALIFEWTELMKDYAGRKGHSFSRDLLMERLVWLDPERDTAFVRSLLGGISADGNSIYCVWSGRKLRVDRFDIDHCFPFAAWPCNDLWNLLPTAKEVNNSKSDKLITLRTLDSSKDRIAHWWQMAYLDGRLVSHAERFSREAEASLPLSRAQPFGTDSFLENMFDAMSLKRTALKHNQFLADWEP